MPRGSREPNAGNEAWSRMKLGTIMKIVNEFLKMKDLFKTYDLVVVNGSSKLGTALRWLITCLVVSIPVKDRDIVT